jgi:hypothetical protein
MGKQKTSTKKITSKKTRQWVTLPEVPVVQPEPASIIPTQAQPQKLDERDAFESVAVTEKKPTKPKFDWHNGEKFPKERLVAFVRRYAELMGEKDGWHLLSRYTDAQIIEVMKGSKTVGGAVGMTNWTLGLKHLAKNAA